MPKTKKVQKRQKRQTKRKQRVMRVTSRSQIPAFEKSLKTAGQITFVLVYGEWCGACHRFQKNIWNPMCKGSARHRRAAIRDDMVPNSSILKNTKFDYLPSILVVNEQGAVEEFKKPEGTVTNAMPTPQSLDEMKRIVNVPVAEGNDSGKAVKTTNTSNTTNTIPLTQTPATAMKIRNTRVNTLSRVNTPFPPMEPITTQESPRAISNAPEGKVYIPTPQQSPRGK